MREETNTEETAPATETVETELDFSVDAVEETPDSSEETGESVADSTEDYQLELDELEDDDKPYVGILTKNAQVAGLDAKAASKFIIGFTKDLRAYHSEQMKLQRDAEVKALKKEWGKTFSDKYTQTKNFMASLFGKAKLTEEERGMFTTPAGYRVFRKFMGVMGERQTSRETGVGAPSISKEEQLKQEVKKLVAMRNAPEVNLSEIEAQRALINKIAGIKLY